MEKNIKQIDVTEALERTRNNKTVYVLVFGKTVTVKKFNKLPVGEVLTDNEYIFFVIEEG